MAGTIKLESCDQQIFEVPTEVVMMSATIKTMLENLGMEGQINDEVVPLPGIEGEVLTKVIEWCKKHVDDDPKPDIDDYQEKRTDDIPEWDVEFLKVDQQTLFAIVRAANFLDIKGLMDVTCKTVANMIKGKSPDEIKEFFDIMPNTAADEEEKAYNAFFEDL